MHCEQHMEQRETNILDTEFPADWVHWSDLRKCRAQSSLSFPPDVHTLINCQALH